MAKTTRAAAAKPAGKAAAPKAKGGVAKKTGARADRRTLWQRARAVARFCACVAAPRKARGDSQRL